MIGRLVAFVPSTDLDRSAAFYADVLGLDVRDRNPYALVLDGGGTTLRVTLVEAKGDAAYTVLGWQVSDIETAVQTLRDRGVAFRRYDGMAQDEHDTWRAPGGSRLAWFADPDGNTLSLEQPPV
jgi:catechol 2,3-dioxygenase-like lactoylglutathione lyase family enzyme